MVMTVVTKINPPGADFFYTAEWYQIVEDHRIWLLQASDNQIQPIQPHLMTSYTGDLNGYLNTLQIPPYMHWVIARMNNLASLEDFNSEKKSLVIPTEQTIERLRKLAMTS